MLTQAFVPPRRNLQLKRLSHFCEIVVRHREGLLQTQVGLNFARLPACAQQDLVWDRSRSNETSNILIGSFASVCIASANLLLV
jgi:hypothetical protein